MLENINYRIVRKLNNDLIRQILKFTQEDVEIIKNTTDNNYGKGRFANVDNLKKWLEKERDLFLFVNENGDLLGIIWFGKENSKIDDLNQYDTTFAIRLYEKARGKKLAQKFTEEALTTYLKENSSSKIWLSSETSNQIANKLYTKMFKFFGCFRNRNYYIIN